ncbi:AAA family ATPase [Actinoplanes sp. NPDC049265]|uniref:AAA family ATPase n=1 Tax=Actinoplanes sp. NPDC049265 TaxID=3363902 RepID=UPI00371C481B
MDSGGVIVITGAMAAGKSTVADLLASRLPRAAHVRGDLFRRMIVSGRREVTPRPDPEADAQLALRYRLAATVADEYARAGFTAVVQDVILGPDLATFTAMITTRPCHVIVLAPRPEILARREERRPKRGYGEWTPAALDASLRDETPRIGLWLDSSDQTPSGTADAILAHVRTSAGDVPAARG